MKDIYTTVSGYGEAEITEKRSRFIATVKPIETEADAIEFINALKQKYWNASHNVYAYIIEENNIMRYSDDGEPGGTAGLPVLDMMKKSGLTNTVVVVTRYFGGTLLGTGGLVHAYSKSAKAGIDAAGILEMILCKEIFIKCEYTNLGKLQNELSKWTDIIKGEIEYADKVIFPIYVPSSQADNFCSSINDKMNAQLEITEGKLDYYGRDTL